MEPERTKSYTDARETLPESLRPLFDELVADYKFASTKHHGRGYVSHKCLAELVRNGWRPSAQPLRAGGSQET